MNELRKNEIAKLVRLSQSYIAKEDYESASVVLQTCFELQDEAVPVHETIVLPSDFNEFLDGYALEYVNALSNEATPALQLLMLAYQDVFGDKYEALLNVLLNHVHPDLLDAIQDL